MATCPQATTFPLRIDYNLSYGNATELPSLMPVDESFEEKIKLLNFVAYDILLSGVLFFGIAGNLLNLVVLRKPNLKNVTFVYLTWIALADLLALVFTLIATLRHNGIFSKDFISAFFYSHLETPLMKAFQATDIYIVVALSVDRFFCMCFPTRFQEMHDKKCAKRFIVAAYIAAILVHVPLCFRKHTVSIMSSGETIHLSCSNRDVMSHPLFKVYVIAKEILVRLAPALIMVFLNIPLYIAFRISLKKRHDLIHIGAMSLKTQNRYNKKENKQKKILALLTGTVVIFFITNTPAAVLRAIHVFADTKQFKYDILRATAYVLDVSNCAVNFYFYYVFNPEFRHTFLDLIRCSKTKSLDSSAAKMSPHDAKIYD